MVLVGYIFHVFEHFNDKILTDLCVLTIFRNDYTR